MLRNLAKMKPYAKIQKPIKDFSIWHKRKSYLHNDKNRPFFHEREVWWCSLGANVGFEQDGTGKRFDRPVIIFKKFNNDIFWAIPLTSKLKKGKYYSKVCFGNDIKNTAILSQIRLVDAKRLLDKVGVISASDYSVIKKAIVSLVEK